MIRMGVLNWYGEGGIVVWVFFDSEARGYMLSFGIIVILEY